MANSFNNRKKSLLALLLSATMVFSTVAGFASCNTSTDDSDSDPTTTETDTARIQNGSFEFFDDNDGKNLIITSVNNWTKTNNSSSSESTYSSQTASGIIDTDAEKWENLTESALDEGVLIQTEADAQAYWSQMSAFDKLSYLDKWKSDEANKDKQPATSLSFYDADTDNYNISYDDIPLVDYTDPSTNEVSKVALANPLTHDFDPNSTEEQDTAVLMLHNYYTNYRGTAQKYTSSTTITIEAGTSAKVSLWVKTSDLKYANSSSKPQVVNGNRGAYIGITHTAGGETLDQWQVKNIDTEAYYADKGTVEHNGWVQYHFYLQGCSYASSTFTMVLGLGQADGSAFEFVNGYAFFDDVECTLISNNTFANETASVKTVDIDTKGENKQLLADVSSNTDINRGVKGQTTFALDLYSGFTSYDITSTTTVGLTEEVKGGKTFVAANDGNLSADRLIPNALGEGLDITNDTVGAFTLTQLRQEAAAKANSPLANILDKDFARHEAVFGANTPILMMLSVDGANYTATIEDSTFVLDKDEKMTVSFFIKTSALRGTDKLSLVAVDNKGQETILSALDASSVQPVDIDKTENPDDVTEDIYDSWQQCFFFLKNDTEEDGLTFSLKFRLGSNSVSATKADYTSGYAAITGFQVLPQMSATQYKCTMTGTYSAQVLLTAEEEKTTKDLFDTPVSLPLDAIETGIANPANYKGVYGGSGYVNNTSYDNRVNDNAYAGLINKNYIDNYLAEVANDSTGDYWASKLGLTTETAMSAFFGNGADAATQPLLIYNAESTDQAYGFIGTAQTVTSGSAPTVVSLRVKVSAGAQATVVLADMDDYSHESLLSISRKLTYWYDSKGNVCLTDPNEDFNERTDIAFKLQPNNGLYKATAVGEALTGVDKDAYYFNLQNYEKDDQGNLLVAEGGVSYDYTNAWKHDGNDGIAFYYKDGEYYADSKYTTLVKDLASIDELPVRYTKTATPSEMTITVTGDSTDAISDDVWQTVTFFINGGSKAKNFRLEVWSGSRDGTTGNAPGSYVLVSKNSLALSDSASFTTKVQEYVDILCEENDWTEEEFKEKYADAFYAAYSFYDDNTFLRYNKDLDENGVENKYDDYNPADSATYPEGVAYMKASVEIAGEKQTVVFANFSLIEQSPSVDSDTTTDSDDSTDTDDETSETDVWLLASSLLVAVALLVAVVALIVRKLTAKLRKRKVQAAASQSRSVKNRRYSSKNDK